MYLTTQRHHPLSNAEQVAVIYLGVHDHLNELKTNEITAFEKKYLSMLRLTRPDLLETFDQDPPLTEDQSQAIDVFIKSCLFDWRQEHPLD